MQRIFDAITSGVAMAALVLLLLDISEIGSRAPYFFSIANAVAMFVFVTDILLRIWKSSNRRAYVRQNWLDFIVLLSLLQYAGGLQKGPWILESLTADTY